MPAALKFVLLRHPTESGKIILAEQAEFTYLSHFLYTDFYRGLTAGNAPAAVTTAGGIFYSPRATIPATATTSRRMKLSAPSVRWAHTGKSQRYGRCYPAQKQYAKVYNRLKMRKQRGKISVDEWNAAVARA